MSSNKLTSEAYNKVFPDSFQLSSYVIKIVSKQIEEGNYEVNLNSILKNIVNNPPNKEKK